MADDERPQSCMEQAGMMGGAAVSGSGVWSQVAVFDGPVEPHMLTRLRNCDKRHSQRVELRRKGGSN